MTGPGQLNSAPPQPRLRLSVMLGLGGVVAGVAVLLMYGSWGWLPFPVMPAIPGIATVGPQDVTQLPAAFTKKDGRYGGIVLTREPVKETISQVIPLEPQQAVVSARGEKEAGWAEKAVAVLIPPAPTPEKKESSTLPAARAVGPVPPKEAQPRKGWADLATPTRREAQTAVPPTLLQEQAGSPAGAGVVAQTRQGTAGAQDLIQPARWAIPAEPLKTLYRSMLLPGRLMDNINSDIPASTIRIVLTIPIYDKFNYGQMILDKGSLIIAKQEGRPDFGQRRLPLRIEQIELPSGEIVSLKATVGDEYGAAGVPGKVNAHTGKLLLATGINAILNIGLSSVVGTPGRGQFYQNPAQQALQEAGQSVAQDVNSLTRQQLRVPPTIEEKAGKIVSVSLEENIQFSKKAVVVK